MKSAPEANPRRRIIDAVTRLNGGQGVAPHDIAKASALTEATVRRLCPEMVAAGKLARSGVGKYVTAMPSGSLPFPNSWPLADTGDIFNR